MSAIFQLSAKAADLKARVERFMDEHIYPNEAALFHTADTQPDRWEPLALLQELKEKAKAQGLWNLFLPDSEHGAGLPTSNTRRWPKSWAARIGARRCSTAPRPTPATWRCWSAMAARSRRSAG